VLIVVVFVVPFFRSIDILNRLSSTASLLLAADGRSIPPWHRRWIDSSSISVLYPSFSFIYCPQRWVVPIDSDLGYTIEYPVQFFLKRMRSSPSSPLCITADADSRFDLEYSTRTALVSISRIGFDALHTAVVKYSF